MNNLISIDTLIKLAKQKNVNFGKGNPYNRLRYYTKMGWLPHMVRQKDEGGAIKGHYPEWALNQLLHIEDLKNQGLSNEDIESKLKVRNRFQDIMSSLNSKEIRNQIVLYSILFLLFLILANETEIISLGKQKSVLQNTTNASTTLPNQIIESGNSFIPKNQRMIFVRVTNISNTSKVYVTFNKDYSPATRYWVSEIRGQSGFLVEVDAPVADNTNFNWWITN